jgi:hypothetical protein
MGYTRKPNYHFRTKNDTGIDKVPLHRHIIVEDYEGDGSNVMKFFVKTGGDSFDENTTIETALSDPSVTDLNGSTEQGITTLQTDLGTAEGNITTLQTDLGTAEGNITTLQTDLGTAEGNITTLQTDLGTLDSLVNVGGDGSNFLADDGSYKLAIKSDTSLALGGLVVSNIVTITQAQYNALTTPNPSTFYVIVD